VTQPLLEVRDLKVHFPGPRSLFGKAAPIRAVDGVSFAIEKGKTLSLVGESGCGKSTTGYALLRLVSATSGQVLLDKRDLLTCPAGEMRQHRRRIQIIFQDAAASLDPRMPIGDLLAEVLDIHGLHRGPGRTAYIRRLLDQVGIPSHFIQRYPFELSGGQAQRIALCRALAAEPDLIVCDEPIAALDVSIQAQIVNLMQDLQREYGLAYLFISHDLAVVRHISHRIAVMYLGRIVEQADKTTLFERPAHPYTRALLSAVPIPDPEIEASRQRIVLSGEIPSPANPPSGCVFRTRCPEARAACADAVPESRMVGENHNASCVFA
jgi:oligopeptide transport system ATP-binding protein